MLEYDMLDLLGGRDGIFLHFKTIQQSQTFDPIYQIDSKIEFWLKIIFWFCC